MIDFSLLVLPTPKTINAYRRMTAHFHRVSSRAPKRRKRFEQWFIVAMLKGSLPTLSDVRPLWPEICVNGRWQTKSRFNRLLGDVVIDIINRQQSMADDVEAEVARRTKRASRRY